jgi:cephalosporin hydroxylase
MTTMPVVAPWLPATIADPFHRAYYDSGVWFDRTTWLGVPLWKQPLDLWIYQELISRLRPDVIVETGTWQGGSALYLANMCDLIGHGQIVTIDVAAPEPDHRPHHDRITYIHGSSISADVVERVRAICEHAECVLVILDSDHSLDHVLAELEVYAPLVTTGSYVIVEDTDLNGHPVRPDWGPGPAEAVARFLQLHPDFAADPACEKFGMTFHPGGFLQRQAERPIWQVPFVPPPGPHIPPLTLIGVEEARRARVLFLCDRDDNNQGQWRIARPCLEAVRHSFVADWMTFDHMDAIQNWISGGRYNVVVTPRWTFLDDSGHDRWAESRARDGLVWIYETDDDLFSPECVDREVRVFGKDKAEMEKQRVTRLRMLNDCDGVIVSRPQLVEVVQRYTDKPVVIVPNAIDVDWFEARLAGRARQVEPLTIGWSGAARDKEDLLAMAGAWEVIAKDFPAVRFVVQGSDHMHPLINAVPRERVTVLPWTTVNEHPATLLNIDIACCSVTNTEWNLCKSPNKWMESTLAGSACVVSSPLYGEYVRHGHDGLVADSLEGWIGALGALVDDPNLRAHLNRNARMTLAREHALSTQWWRGPVAWASLLDQAQSNGSNNTRQSHANRQPAPV